MHFTIDTKRVRAEGVASVHANANANEATISGEAVATVGPTTAVNADGRITFAIDTDGLQYFDSAPGAAIWS